MSSKRLFAGRQYLGRAWEGSLFRGVGDAEASLDIAPTESRRLPYRPHSVRLPTRPHNVRLRTR